MKEELKRRLQCKGCNEPRCDIPCDNLQDDTIDLIMELANQRVIEELEEVLSYYIEYGIYSLKDLKDRINKLKQEI
tara:strand:+ start:393 stop:620 length:228 start_codon:yes stop_codon:yes gene_type:complete